MIARFKAAWAAFLDPVFTSTDSLQLAKYELTIEDSWARDAMEAEKALRQVLAAHTLWAAQDAARKALGEGQDMCGICGGFGFGHVCNDGWRK